MPAPMMTILRAPCVMTFEVRFGSWRHIGACDEHFRSALRPHLSDLTGSSEQCPEQTWPLRLSRRQRFRDLSGGIDEKLCGGAERASFHGDDADRHASQ